MTKPGSHADANGFHDLTPDVPRLPSPVKVRGWADLLEGSPTVRRKANVAGDLISGGFRYNVTDNLVQGESFTSPGRNAGGHNQIPRGVSHRPPGVPAGRNQRSRGVSHREKPGIPPERNLRYRCLKLCVVRVHDDVS